MSAKTLIKKSLYELCRLGGVNRFLRRKHRSELLILNYHGVVIGEYVRADLSESVESFLHRNAISLVRFRDQLKMLRKQFHPVAAQDVLDWVGGRVELPPNPVLVTFDDGFQNNATVAAPVLEELGIPAVFHVTTGYIGTRRILWPLELDQLILQWPHEKLPLPTNGDELIMPASRVQRCDVCETVRKRCKSIPNSAREEYLNSLRAMSPLDGSTVDEELNAFMSWDEVRSLAERGFAIGSHTVEHPILTKLDEQELCRELQESKRTIEQETGRECPILAYPNGGPEDVSPQVVDAAESAGYKLGLTLLRGFNQRETPSLKMNRINISSDIGLAEFQAMASGLYTLLKGTS